MSKNYNMYKLFRGESECPFPEDSKEAFFWYYESVFEDHWQGTDASDWYAFFKNYEFQDRLMAIVRDLPDSDSPIESKKSAIFSLWLEYLFKEHLQSTSKKAMYDKIKSRTATPGLKKHKMDSYQCKYYKGESKNPFNYSDVKYIFWECENRWKSIKDESHKSKMLDQYDYFGLKGHKKDDGVPMSLKAEMLNWYYQHGGEYDTAQGFIDLYKSY